MPISKTTGRESTHASTLRGGATKKIHAPDAESVVRFAETLRLRSLAAATRRKLWVVHCQPAGTGDSVVKYLARYVARTAISEERIIAADDERVVFGYTDTQTQQRRHCALGAAEFLRRYLQHVPPSGRHRVRYFGWMHPAAKARRRVVETLLVKPILVVAAEPPTRWHLRCPHCAGFTLVRVGTLPRQARAPSASGR